MGVLGLISLKGQGLPEREEECVKHSHVPRGFILEGEHISERLSLGRGASRVYCFGSSFLQDSLRHCVGTVREAVAQGRV